MVVAPSLNVTVPVAVRGLRVAVSVTLSPYAVDVSEEARVVMVEALLISCVTAVEVLPLYVAFPAYTAVRLWLPTPRLDTTMEPLPCPSVAESMVVAPSLKVTVPVAVRGLIVAVNVTPSPYVVEVSEDPMVVVVVIFTIAWPTASDVLPL